jgi:oligosaccharide repeat unit polymerase
MSVLFCFLFLISMVAIFFLTKNWLSLSRIHVVLWTFLFLGYCLFGEPETLTFVGPLWFFLSFFAMLTGEKIGERAVASKEMSISVEVAHCKLSKETKNTMKPTLPPYTWCLLVLFVLFAFLGNVLYMRQFGYNLTVFFSPSKLAEMSSVIIADKYSSNPKSTTFIVLLNAFQYVSALSCSYCLVYAKNKKQVIICLLFVIPVITSSLISTAKSSLIASFFLAAAGMATGFVSIYHRAPNIKIRQLVIILLLCVFFGLFLFILMMVRAGGFTQENFQIIRHKFSVYAFGEFGVFDTWVSQHFSFSHYTFGVSTFMAPFSLLGLVTKNPGIYSLIEGTETNVFTAYRGLITDFGYTGSLLFMIFLGFLGNVSLQKIMNVEHPNFYRTLYGMSFFFICHIQSL